MSQINAVLNVSLSCIFSSKLVSVSIITNLDVTLDFTQRGITSKMFKMERRQWYYFLFLEIHTKSFLIGISEKLLFIFVAEGWKFAFFGVLRKFQFF